jgi:flagellar FliL protein
VVELGRVMGKTAGGQFLPGRMCLKHGKSNDSLTTMALAGHQAGIIRKQRHLLGRGMAAEAEIGAEVPTKKGINKLFVIIGAAAAVVLVGGAGLFFFLSSGSATDASGAHGAGGDVAAIAADTFIFNLEPIMVNLNSVDGQQNYMKLTVALEVADEETMTAIQPRLAKVVDAFQVYMRELRKSDLEGSAGIYRLKEELLRRVNLAVYPARVESVLFKEILVQ